MKKSLQFLTATFLCASTFLCAQTKVWNFETWEISGGHQAKTVIDNLGIYPQLDDEGSVVNMAAVNANNATFPDSFKGTKRLQMNGAGWAGTVDPLTNPAPTQRSLFFAVTGNVNVKVWFKTGSGTTERSLYLTDAKDFIKGVKTSTSDGFAIMNIDYTYVDGVKNLYLSAGAAVNLYKIEVMGKLGVTKVEDVILSVTDIKKKHLATLATIGNTIHLKNIKSLSQIEVFNANGQLVKTLNTAVDTQFDVQQKGLYFVNIKTDNKVESTKVLVR